ncbi:MAG TPA: hypothetical protein VMG12_17745, partial [Polyangiaceae bacterium]|nr:hypothetical protein [Polyangiaceae bacterium]
ETYIAAFIERDPVRREQLLNECFAVDGRLVTRHRVIQGRAALAADIARFHRDFRWRSVHRLSPIDVGSRTFRYRGVVEFEDGTTAEAFDAGEVNADGKISLVLTFDGPLASI